MGAYGVVKVWADGRGCRKWLLLRSFYDRISIQKAFQGLYTVVGTLESDEKCWDILGVNKGRIHGRRGRLVVDGGGGRRHRLVAQNLSFDRKICHLAEKSDNPQKNLTQKFLRRWDRTKQEAPFVALFVDTLSFHFLFSVAAVVAVASHRHNLSHAQ